MLRTVGRAPVLPGRRWDAVTIDAGFADSLRIRYPDLLRIGYLLTGSAAEAEDLVQAALLRAMRTGGASTTPSRTSGAPWPTCTSVGGGGTGPGSCSLPRCRIGTCAIPAKPSGTGRAVRRPEGAAARARAVIVLRYWVDLSEADTAQMLGCSVGSVKSTASRGLARLRTALQPVPDMTTRGNR